jgi:hypothetical protein
MLGPDGDYVGTPSRALDDAAQRAVYTGYKKCHSLKVEMVLLANGISTLFGPTLARIHDVHGVLQMSGLDNFLVEYSRVSRRYAVHLETASITLDIFSVFGRDTSHSLPVWMSPLC